MKSESTIRPALILIDVQKGIDDAEYWGGNRNNPEAEGNINLLLRYWEENGLPVVIVTHKSATPASPFFPGKPGCDLKDFVAPQAGWERIEKSTANAFINTMLETTLRQSNIKTLFIAGFVTNNSVEATARMAGELGFDTCVVSDATAAFNKKAVDGGVYSSEQIHQISLANLNGEYASIKTTRQVLEQIRTDLTTIP